jgi:hypothetical protein
MNDPNQRKAKGKRGRKALFGKSKVFAVRLPVSVADWAKREHKALRQLILDQAQEHFEKGAEKKDRDTE